MSLRIWLPLNGTLDNQGLDDVVVINNGATIDNNGKIGKCYSFGASSYLKVPLPKLSEYSTTTFSMCLWAKVPSPTSGNKQLLHIGKGSGWANNRFTILYRGSTTASQIVTSISDGNSYGAYSCYTDIPIDTWIHIASVFDNRKLKLYINGELKNTYNTTYDLSFNSIEALGIGGAPNGAELLKSGYINDVRIYDHALSPLEVKQISQGLILHYPLNRNGWGQENLIVGSQLNGNFTYPSSSYKDWYSPTTTVIPSDSIYTLSFDAKSTVSGDKVVTHYYSPNTTTGVKTSQGYTSSAVDGFAPFTLTTEWQRYWVTYTQSSTTAVKHLICPRLTSGNGTGTVSVKNIKFEEGSIATPWCPNSSDELYNKIGLNNNVEYDTSGYENNGTRTGTFSWTSDTPKYNVSTVFNGTDNAIQTPSLPSMISDKNYTIAVWIYKTVIGSKGYQTIYGGPSGFEIEARNGSANETKFVPWNWGKPMASYELNEWNHCVFVHSDSDCKIYLNGEYIATGTAKASNPSGNYFVGAWNTATQQNFDGLMSDFRIYATALSAEDIKDLYNLGASIDSNNNLLIYELNEE